MHHHGVVCIIRTQTIAKQPNGLHAEFTSAVPACAVIAAAHAHARRLRAIVTVVRGCVQEQLRVCRVFGSLGQRDLREAELLPVHAIIVAGRRGREAGHADVEDA